MNNLGMVFRKALWPNPVRVFEPHPEALAHYTESAKEFIQKLIEELETRKTEVFSDDNTWRTSGPEYLNAAISQEQGYDKAIAELKKIIGD